ncbi:efflux RND transporter permease subunit [Pseudomonas corrugata]|uniref:efflux RND transporter permease subunit n=1 Tax=Pseudomonas corrugata TaxID=47879 RepID=UPI0006D8B329|nr:efflux RND transporter permease subunit [Pseudomonas corrugata]
MSKFFIDRPIFAWVIALVIMLVGALSILKLPINQYPSIAPPAIAIQVTYPGASAQTVQDTVVQVIEQQLNGIDNLRYVSSESNSDGSMTITATFEQGTNSDTAQVQVQNKLNLATPLLPQEVQQQGIRVTKSVKNFLMVIGVVSRDGSMTKDDLSNYIVSNMQDPISRTAGVGDFQVFGAQYAMRIWLDPAKLNNYALTPVDVKTAIAAQNVQVSSGQLGGLPALPGQQLNATIIGKTRLQTAEQFKAILLKVNPDGSQVRVGDVADVGLGGENYSISAQFNGAPASGLAVKLANGANALDTAKALRKTINDLKPFFPQGMEVVFPYDTTPVVSESIKGVVETLVEAVALVFLVMFLFLQNFRATIITTMTVPVVLLGTFGILAAFGFSINTLTMFGMVLAIGLLVDDAIVVVENVERIMASEGLSPKDATRKAMRQITGAIIGITLVLVAVFIPMAFMPGSVGVIYRQFSLSMATSILFSAFLALSLTPALCATLLKPIGQGEHHAKGGFFGWFNHRFDQLGERYQGWVAYALRRTGRYLLIYCVLLVGMGLLFSRLPSSFLPVEDQGYTITDIQLPPGASKNRTVQVVEHIEAHNAGEPGVGDSTVILGFSFSGSGQNAALAFTTLKDWSERGSDDSASAIAERANQAFGGIKDAMAFAVLPPPVDGLGTSSGFEFRLQDRGGLGHATLMQARDALLAAAEKSPVLINVRESALAEAPQVQLEVDRKQANALGVSFADVGNVLATAVGSSYINDFPNQGRMQRVVVQAEGDQRSQVADLLKIHVRNDAGKMVPLSAFVQAKWTQGPTQLTRYNGYPAISISGEPAPGYSTGQAMAEIERLVGQGPAGLGQEWTGLSLQERLSGSQAPILLGLSLLVVFLCLAALYESWSIPTAVLLVVPLGVLGAVLAVSLRGMPNDVFFKVGLVTIIGLSAKNAILIIEFAKSLYDEGHDLIDATLQAARLRLRPIIMTSLAFILGVVPLAIATGASSASQQAIGTGVIGGMISATLAVVFVPVFFVGVMRLVRKHRRDL